MPRKKVPATAGYYIIVIEIPGSRGWVEGIHEAFDRWTLKMAQDGPSEAVEVLPAFEVIDQAGEEPALFKMTFVKCTADSAWAAVEDCAENLAVIVPDLLGDSTALRIGAGAEEVIGREVEIDVP